MASTTTSNPPNVSQQQIFDLSHFLRSIDPSSSSSSEPSQSAPKLPTSATISLLDAQIQTLQSQLSQALTSDRLGFKQKLENNHHAERRLETLWNQVSQISNATYNDQDLESNLRRSIRDYRDVLVESDHHRLLVDCLELVTQATSDLELAEAMLENDDLRALQPHLEKLKNSASKVGACKALATKSLGEGGEGKMLEPDQGPSEDFTFLASHFPEGLPAIKELALRIEAVEETLEKRLQHLWENFFNVHLLDPTGSSQAVELTSIRVSIASSTKGSDKVKALSLSDLAEVSSSRGELRPRLKAMANEVIERCAKILLASDRHPSTGVQVSWMFEEEGGGDDQQFQRFRITARANADGRGQGRLETLQAILAFIQKRLFDVIDPPIEGSSKELDKNIQAKEQADRGRLRTFSEEMIPKLVPLILEHLEGRLPTRADPIEEVMASLEHISGRARDVEASLRTLRFAPADEGTEGLDADEGNDTAASLGRWADEIGSHFSNKLMKRSLERARKLILEEGERGGVADAGPSEKGGGGWEGVVVEVDPKIGATIPAASGDPSDIGDALPTSEASLAKAKVGGVKVKLDAGGDDDTWDDFDNGWNQEEGRLAKASSSTGMSRSVSSSTTNRNSLDSTGSGRASPKSASSSIKSRSRLGGVRVIRHQDQLGSGPFDNEDEIDEQGWGLDDDVVLQGDDGAGIKKVEEEEEGKVKIAQVVKEGGEAESGLGQGEEEQDGPWFKEEREAERKAASDPWEGFGGSGNESKRFQEAGSNEMDRSMTQSSTSSSNKAFEYQEEALDPDLDLDDAWGLTEEEIAEKRMSMIGGAAGVGFDLANQHPLHVHPNLDRTKVEQGQVKQEVEREGFGSIVSGQAPIGPDGRGGDDDDLDLDEAWGLTEEEVREKRASLLWMPSGFTVPKEVQGTDKIHQHVGREGDGSSQGAEQVLAAKVPEGGDIERFAGIVAVGERVDQASTEQDRAEGVELEDPREQASEAPTRREEALLSSRSEGSVLASDELPQPSQIPSAAPLGRVESSLAAESQRLEKKNETDTNPTDQGVREGVDPDRDEDQEGSRKESVREDDQGTEGSDDPWDAIIDDDRQIGEEDQMENQQAQQASQGVQETIVRSQVEKSGGMGQGEEEDGVWGIQRGDSQPIEEGRGDDHVRFGSRVPPFEMEADSTRPTRSNQEKVEVSQEEAEPHDDDDDDEHEGDSHKDGKVYLLHHDSSTGRDHPFATSMESFVPTSDRGTDTTVPSEASHGEGMEEDDPVVAWGLDDDPVVDGDGSEEGFLRANQDGTLERKEGSGLVEKQGRVDGNEGQQGREMENEIAEDRDGPKEQPTALDAGEDVNVAGWGWNEEEEEEEDNKVGGPSVPSTTTRGRNVVAEPRKPFQEVKSSSVSKALPLPQTRGLARPQASPQRGQVVVSRSASTSKAEIKPPGSRPGSSSSGSSRMVLNRGKSRSPMVSTSALPSTDQVGFDSEARRSTSLGKGMGVDSAAASDVVLESKATGFPGREREKCTVSKRSIQIVKLVEETLENAITLLRYETQSGGRGGGGEDGGDPVGRRRAITSKPEVLLDSIPQVLDLHKAIMPVCHGQELSEVPSLAMQFSNDCEYLSRELVRILGQKGGIVENLVAELIRVQNRSRPIVGLKALEAQVEETAELGRRWFNAQMASQAKVLMECMAGTDGFARTYDPERYARCERSLRQVIQTLEQLSKAWRPVLPRSDYLSAMGRLVEPVLVRTLGDVEDLDDIGETESVKLASLVRNFGSLEGLFADGTTGETAVGLFVPSWFKASYLPEILTGSLVDIEFLTFEAGALVDYTRAELVGLIKALFADTANRSRLLEKIESSEVGILSV